MHYETIDGTTHIWCDEGESERDVLRAIANATFETAPTGGMGLLHYERSTLLPEEFLDAVIQLDSDRVLYLDYVQGRQVKTELDRVEPGHFKLWNNTFERDRGKPNAMLNRAIEILGGSTILSQGLTTDMYEGENLDIRADALFQVERMPDESDWEFRKRIFIDHYEVSHEEALCFVLGGSMADLDDVDALLVMINADRFSTKFGRQRFVAGFAGDPLDLRKHRMANA